MGNNGLKMLRAIGPLAWGQGGSGVNGKNYLKMVRAPKLGAGVNGKIRVKQKISPKVIDLLQL